MYLRAQPTEGGLRIQSYSHSLTTEFMGDWSPATPTGLNTSHDYQPDGLVVWPYEGIYIGIGNVFNTVDQNVPLLYAKLLPGAVISRLTSGQCNASCDCQ